MLLTSFPVSTPAFAQAPLALQTPDSRDQGQSPLSPSAGNLPAITSEPQLTPSMQPTGIAPTSTSLATGTSSTATSEPSATQLTFTPIPTPSTTATVGLPTVAPTVTAIPDTNYVDQAIDGKLTELVAQIDALPILTPSGTLGVTKGSASKNNGITGEDGTLVTDAEGGQVKSEDQGLVVAFMPHSIDSTGTSSMIVKTERVTYSSSDPRASRNGAPIAYAYDLTATDSVTDEPIEQFAQDVILMFDLDNSELEAAGVEGSLRVYWYNEEVGQWQTVPSVWEPTKGQLLAFTSHFSEYSVSAIWDKIANFIPSVKSFEVDLQSGTASTTYPINLPSGPGGFGPSVSLSYNSGNVDRVDITQQGSSSVGWGWSLSTSYVAASQKTFSDGADPYHPWTASIVADGISGDLVKGVDDWWHTTNESFAKVLYTAGPSGNRTQDKWEAWDTAGTHYEFDKQALACDLYNGSVGPEPDCPGNGSAELTTYKWMLTKVTDIHNNTISYSYWYEDDEQTITTTPSTTRPTSAVYPRLITYGGTDALQDGKPKLKVEFIKDTRTFTVGGNPTDDISDADRDSNVYQTKRISGINVWRLLASSSSCTTCGSGDNAGYARLRAYQFNQDLTIALVPTVGESTTPYYHLTLNSITPLGADNTTQLPNTIFTYYTGGESFAKIWDQGHLFQAENGYGGKVRFYYDAAGGDVWRNQDIRRVRAKRILDGTHPTATVVTGQSYIWNALYSYDYRGATTNDYHISAEVQGTRTLNLHDSEVRGYAWVREQDPSLQSTDHYFSQSDVYKAKEWRVQVGKEYTFTDAITATPVPSNWTATGVTAGTGGIWKLFSGGSLARNQGVADSSDVSIRFQVAREDEDPDYHYKAYYRLESPNGGNTDYFGIEIYRDNCCPTIGNQYAARVIWSTSGITGTRDLSPRTTGTITALPHPKHFIKRNIWYRLTLHTSADGRMAVELSFDNYYNDDPSNSIFEDYIVIKSGDVRDGGGNIPLFPVGKTWKFKHAVTTLDQFPLATDEYASWVDDYSETRTIYSQSDTYYDNKTSSSHIAATPTTQPLVGLANNTYNMSIRYVPITETWSTSIKWDTWEVETATPYKQFRRHKTTYEYDNTQGAQLAQRNFGDYEISGDETVAFTTYISNTSSWILAKPQYQRLYSGADGITDTENNNHLLSKTINYYDGNSSATATPSKGNLTKITQVGVLNATVLPTTTVSQQFGYDTSTGNQTSVTDPRGNTTSTDYDPYYKSFPIKTTFANTSEQTIEYDYTLDTVHKITDVNGTVTESRYDVFGRPSRSWIVGYGTSTPVAAANEIFGFTDLGEATVTPPFYISYTVKLQEETGPNTHTFGMRWFDGRGRVLQDITPKDSTHVIVADTFYDISSQVIKSSLPYERTTSNPRLYATPDTSKDHITKEYDGIGRTVEIKNPDNTTVQYDYQLQWVSEEDEMGNKIKRTHTDSLGRTNLVLVDDITVANNDLKVDYGYDLLSRLTYMARDAGGTNEVYSTMQYDALGRKSEMYDPDMGTWKYKYDDAGNLTNQRDALYLSNSTLYASHEISFTYDVMNRIKSKYYGQAHWDAGIPDVKYYYDNDRADASTARSWGRLRAAEVTAQGQGQELANGHQYFYDPRGLLHTEAITTGLTTRPYTTTYSYDDAGRLYQTTYPDPEATHEVVTNKYNEQGMGLPFSVYSNIGSAEPVWSSTYNVRGQLTQLLQGSSPYANAATTNYTYDDSTTKRGWLENTQVLVGSGGDQYEALDLTLDYSDNGNILSVNQSATGGSNNPTFTNSYTYDALDRLKTASSSGTTLFETETYTFDSLSRMATRKFGATATPITIGYTSGPGSHIDAPTSYNGYSYTYDAVGNQTGRTISSQTQTRTFDAENRVTRIVSDTYTTDMIYGPNGERVIKSVSASVGGSESVGKGGGSETESLPSPGITNRTLYVGPYEEELPYNKTISWNSLTNASASSPVYSLKKTTTGNSWDAGAISTESITSGSGDGFVSVVADATNTARMFGMGNANTNATQADIEFGLILRSDGTLEVMESGTSKGTYGAYYRGDVLKVQVVSGVVKYYRNSTILYTAAKSPTYPIYLDTSISTSGGVLAGALLCAGTKCVSAPEYISYYSFGDKLVGMRRANASAGNEQFRMVGDHLGSTTLLVDTYTGTGGPRVVQRQYHKPYGETAWQYTATLTGGESLTSVGYTGQRTDEDSTGLMFYNARMYDATLGMFVSADTLISEQFNPQTLHRYSYVANNPLLLIDPSGHSAQPPGPPPHNGPNIDPGNEHPRGDSQSIPPEANLSDRQKVRMERFLKSQEQWRLHDLEESRLRDAYEWENNTGKGKRWPNGDPMRHDLNAREAMRGMRNQINAMSEWLTYRNINDAARAYLQEQIIELARWYSECDFYLRYGYRPTPLELEEFMNRGGGIPPAAPSGGSKSAAPGGGVNPDLGGPSSGGQPGTGGQKAEGSTRPGEGRTNSGGDRFNQKK